MISARRSLCLTCVLRVERLHHVTWKSNILTFLHSFARRTRVLHRTHKTFVSRVRTVKLHWPTAAASICSYILSRMCCFYQLLWWQRRRLSCNRQDFWSFWWSRRHDMSVFSGFSPTWSTYNHCTVTAMMELWTSVMTLECWRSDVFICNIFNWNDKTGHVCKAQ